MTKEQKTGDHAAHYQRYAEYYKAKAMKKHAATPPRDRREYSKKKYWSDPEKYRAKSREKYKNAPAEVKVRMKVWRDAHYQKNKPKFLARMRAAAYKRNYGITVEQYDQLLAQQSGACAICGGKERTKRLAVDHDHVSGAVRGLLCHVCNKVLGAFGDDSMKFARAIAYLETASGRSKEN